MAKSNYKTGKKYPIECEKGFFLYESYGRQRKNQPEITPLQLAINTIPLGTAVCERDQIRSNLTTDNISNLLFININGPPTEIQNPVQYVKSRLLTHTSAEDTRFRIVIARTTN